MIRSPSKTSCHYLDLTIDKIIMTTDGNMKKSLAQVILTGQMKQEIDILENPLTMNTPTIPE